jgi:hypothetical protein
MHKGCQIGALIEAYQRSCKSFAFVSFQRDKRKSGSA